MQRPGQPQRTTSIGPAAQFRQPYPTYGMPARANSTTPFPPNLQRNPQTPSQTMSSQNSFMQPRQTPFAFGGAAQQSSSQTQQVPQTPTLPSTPAASLDDFPALGSTPANSANQSSSTVSYAAQAGTGLLAGSAIAAPGALSQASRDFTPDDFPALSAQSNAPADGPPGLNGFQHNTLNPLQPPGMLTLTATQARSIHPGFQGGQADTEKQLQQQRANYALKMSQAAWNSPTLTQAASNGQTAGFLNGTHSPSVLTAPPGVTAASGSHTPATTSFDRPAATYSSNGLVSGESSNNTSPPEPPNTSTEQSNSHNNHIQQHPETPAQQILMSAADRWGLLGLLAMIKNGSGGDQLSSVGTDLSVMGLDMNHPGDLYSSFITPWSDSSALEAVEPEFHVPACYNVQPPPPGPSKATAFSDETLFFMFFSSPRDAQQEVAAQELFSRNWRYHKELRMWITKESGSTISRKIPGGEEGHYTVWDHEIWAKEGREMTVRYDELEEKTNPAFQQGAGFVLANSQPQQAQPQLQPLQPTQLAQRASFQM